MGNRKVWKYQVVEEWSMNRVLKEHDQSLWDTEEKALEKAQKLTKAGRIPVYVTKVLYKVEPEVEEIKVTIEEIK